MNIACLTFTQSGSRIAARILSGFEGHIEVFTKSDYKKNLNRIFEEYDGVIFISSTGIAVRLCAPFLKDKIHDPAVVVVDNLGRYAISLISGHIGGANALAQEIADILGCQPIITTASDGRGIEAVDLFAKRNNLIIEDLNDAKTITAMMIAGRPITLISEIDARIGYEHLVDENSEGRIYVTSQNQVNCNVPYCVLRPKNLHIGIGCQRGKTKEEILGAITKVFQNNNLSLKSIRSIATIEVKKGEAGIIETCNVLTCELKICTIEEIRNVQHLFLTSEFVQSKVGVTAVCEPCAYLAGGEIIVGKTIINGVTIAVAKDLADPANIHE